MGWWFAETAREREHKMRTVSGWSGRRVGIPAVLLWIFGVCGALEAAQVAFVGSLGSLEATATFEDVGTDLFVTLRNTSLNDVLVPADVLTAVFFDIAGDPVLTPVYGKLFGGSVVFFGGTDPGGVIGGEWAYATGLTGAPGDASQGISSTGLDLFGPPDLFPGTDLDFPPSPDGLNYGLTSAGDNPATGNWPVTGKEPLIKNGVIFKLGGLSGGFALSDISNVWFQYGTDLDEPSFPHIPEPNTLLLFGSAIVALAGSRRFMRRR